MVREGKRRPGGQCKTPSAPFCASLTHPHRSETGNLEATAGKVHSVDSATFSQHEIATETTVVDGIGQRLTLQLENIRGGGGQRRISLFCPFWIVNTTEHSLLYKQEKSKAFVSGTVHGPEKDGSRPVDGSNRNRLEDAKNQSLKRELSKRKINGSDADATSSAAINVGTIFAGTPGALATTPGCCKLPASKITELIDKNLPLVELARFAFMFNFHDEGLSIGHNMLSVQLHDGSETWNYTSEWSRGFSLDSVGYSQIVA